MSHLHITGVSDQGDACYDLAMLFVWIKVDREQALRIYTEGLVLIAEQHFRSCPECQQLLAKSSLVEAAEQAKATVSLREKRLAQDSEFREREAAADAEGWLGQIIDYANTLANQHEFAVRTVVRINDTASVATSLVMHLEALLRET